MIVRSIGSGMASGRAAARRRRRAVRRTENDMPMRVVLFGSLGLLVLLAVFLMTEVGLVSGRRRGAAGRAVRLPVRHRVVPADRRDRLVVQPDLRHDDGHADADLPDLPGPGHGPVRATALLALSIAAVVCIAASNGGTTAQSLKTGFLVGGTPKAMQYAILIGALVSALVIGGTLLVFNEAGTVYSSDPQYLPQRPDRSSP